MVLEGGVWPRESKMYKLAKKSGKPVNGKCGGSADRRGLKKKEKNFLLFLS